MGIGFTTDLDDMMFTTKVAIRRRLVLIDIENVSGGGIQVAQQVRDVRDALADATSLDFDNDHIVLACGRESARIAGFAWSGNRRFVFRPGVDGADLELLAILETERIADRFTDVLLISGDAIFTDAVASLGAQGVNVTVASRPRALSRRLRMAASQVIELEYDNYGILEAA